MKKQFAVIFDMDGVIIDNLAYHVKSWQLMARKHGGTISKKEFFKTLNGRTGKDTINRIFHRKVAPGEARLMAEDKERIYRELYDNHRKLLPGLLVFLKALRKQGVKCAVATSAPPKNVTFILDHFKIRKYFTAVVDAAGVTHSKPNPEIFLKAAKKIGAHPNHCVVFEDALLGVEAGRRARMKVVGVTTTHTKKEMAHADFTIKDFKRLNSQDIAQLLEKS